MGYLGLKGTHADRTGNRAYYVMIACSCVPCFAFFAHRTWLMYKRHWIIPVIFLPMILTSGSSFIAIAVLCDSLPMSRIVKAFVFALVRCLLSLIVSLINRRMNPSFPSWHVELMEAIGLVRADGPSDHHHASGPKALAIQDGLQGYR